MDWTPAENNPSAGTSTTNPLVPTNVLDAIYKASTSLISTSIGASGSQEYEKISVAYNNVLTFSRQGHGPRLEGDAPIQMAYLMDLFLLAIDSMIEGRGKLALTSLKTQPDEALLFTDAIVLGSIFLHYMECISEYESTFPATPLQLQTQGWQMTLKSQAGRLASHHTYIASIAHGLDLAIGYKFLDSERAFIAPICDKLDQLTQLDQLLQVSKLEFERLAPQLALDWVEEAWTEAMKYFEATMLVPKAYEKELETIYQLEAPPATISALVFGTSTFVSEQVEYPWTQAARLVARHAEKQQVLMDATTYATRMLSKMVLSFSEEVNMQPWARMIGEIPMRENLQTVSDPHYATFKAPNPLSPVIEKYKVDDTGAISWVYEPSLFQTIERYGMIADSVSSSNLMYWEDHTPALPTDVISAPLYNSFVPANYTQTRNRRRESYDFQRYLYLIEGTYPDVPTRYVMTHIAELLVNQPASYARPLLVALASTMSVALTGDKAKETADAISAVFPTGQLTVKKTSVKLVKSEEDVYVLTPPLAAIYGVPTEYFYDVQIDTWANRGKMIQTTFNSMSKQVTTKKCGVLFVLHPKAFKPGVTALVPSVLRRGTVTQIPYNVDVLLKVISAATLPENELPPLEVIPTGAVSLSTAEMGKIVTSETISYIAPFKLVAPHLSFRSIKATPSVANDVAMARIKIGSFKDKYTGNLVLGAQFTPEYIYMDADSFSSEWEATDPLPQEPRVKEVQPTQHNDEEAERTPGLGDPPPPVSAASSERSLADQAAQARASGADDTAETNVEVAKPLAGAPEEQAEEDANRAKKLKKYINAAGEVKWLAPGDEIPEGFTPADESAAE